MKNKLFSFIFLSVAFLAASFAFSPTEANAQSFYETSWTGTITNAGNDTLYFPARLRPVMSDFIQSYSISRTNVSGTTNVAVKVEESNYRYTGTTPPTAGWVTAINNLGAAADTDGTGATEELIKLPASYGVSYRVIIDGTGTQSTTYAVRAVLKKK